MLRYCVGRNIEMKTLIIDNYDSFTYNLVHLFAEVLDSEPTVIKNDDSQWCMEYINDFDQIVISPGPGHPQIEKDMGISNQILSQSQYIRPLFGICLGYQGLCFAEGACVSKAPEVVHGRRSIVRHTGENLFKDIPDSFAVVRYHSLVVTDLPSQLQPLAWTDDNVLMAVAHKVKPYWGVQFHPESIITDYGQQLVKNFCDMSASYNAKTDYKRDASTGNTIRSDLYFVEKDKNISSAKMLWYRKLPFYRESNTIFVSLFGTSQRAFWLDSNDHKSKMSQISIMGDASSPNSRCVYADVSRHSVVIKTQSGKVSEVANTDFFSWLNSDLQSINFKDTYKEELPFEVRPGWFGHLGYELKAECGGAKAHKAPLPDAAMIFAERIVVLDHQNKAIYLLALSTEETENDIERWADSLEAKLATVEALDDVSVSNYPTGHELKLRQGPEDYLKCIDECQRQIANGESYEVCLTNLVSFSLDKEIDPLILYRKLRADNPTSFSAFIRWPDWSVLSFSPERFMRINNDHCAESRPMKGTRKRSSDSKKDHALLMDLASNPKDKSENLMIVDLVRNDLGRCASLCGVSAEQLFKVETYATVHQMVSTITAKLRVEATAVDCVRASFPGGSMTGAPKVRTMEIIDRLEGGARGIYSGAIGYFAVNDVADFSIVIRSLVVDQEKITLGVGGAIIALSDPILELEEIGVKSQALLEPFGLGFPLMSDEIQSTDPVGGMRVAGSNIMDTLQKNIRKIFTENKSSPVLQFWSTCNTNDEKDFAYARIEVVGFDHDILFHAIRGDEGGVSLGSGSIFLVTSDEKVELHIAGVVRECFDLESDALFSTLSRAQQLKAWYREERRYRDDELATVVERYEGQAIARPKSFQLYRLSPGQWQRELDELSAENEFIVQAAKAGDKNIDTLENHDSNVLLIFS